MNRTDIPPPSRPETEHPTTFTHHDDYDWKTTGATSSDSPWQAPAKKRRGKKRGQNAGAFGKGGRK